MSRARVARRIATAAAYGGGGISLLGGAVVGVLLTEMEYAKRRLGGGEEAVPPVSDGLYGTAFAADPGTPWRMAVLGDSTAAGLGVRRAGQTPGGLLASGLAAVSERPVELHNVALSGARSDDLERQVSLLLTEPGRAPAPDICVIIIGANDITGRVPPARSVQYLSEAVSRLRAAGSRVVVGTCPDLGSVEPVGQPLRWLARRLCRQLAAAQTIAVVERGGRTVSLGDLLGPEFAANPRELFGPDRYHPSAEGYATAAMAILPTVCAALGTWPGEERPDRSRRENVLPVARAAAEAAAEGGTEVTPAPGVLGTAPHGAADGVTDGARLRETDPAGGGTRRAPWALLKHRRRRRVPEPGQPPAPDAVPGGAPEGAPENAPAETSPADVR